MYWRMYSGHNCTNYAAYRMVQERPAQLRPWTGSGNATNWGTSMSRDHQRHPAVGSVAWWKAGVYPAGSAGHVAYVEKVVSANEIIVSHGQLGRRLLLGQDHPRQQRLAERVRPLQRRASWPTRRCPTITGIAEGRRQR